MTEQAMPNPRVLKIAVLVMGVLLLVGFGVVIVTIALRAANPKAERGVAAPHDIAVALGPDGRVEHLVLDGRRLALDLVDGTGRRVVVVDLGAGRATDIIRLGPAIKRSGPAAAPR